MDYEPGTGSKQLFPKMHLETCGGPLSSVRTTVELQTSHIGKGCDRETYSEKSLQKLCGQFHSLFSLSVVSRHRGGVIRLASSSVGVLAQREVAVNNLTTSPEALWPLDVLNRRRPTDQRYRLTAERRDGDVNWE